MAEQGPFLTELVLPFPQPLVCPASEHGLCSGLYASTLELSGRGTAKPGGEMGRHSLKFSCFTVYIFLTIKTYFEILNFVNIGESWSSKLSGVKDQEVMLRVTGWAHCWASCSALAAVVVRTWFPLPRHFIPKSFTLVSSSSESCYTDFLQIL